MRIIANEKRLKFYSSCENKHVQHHQQNYLQEQSCSSRTYLQQKHAAAATCRSNKKQKAPTSRTTVYPALLGTRRNQRHLNEKIALIFFIVLFVRDQAEQHMKLKNNTKLLFEILDGRHVYYIPMLTLYANRLGILSPSYLCNHQASSAVSAPQQRPTQGSTVNKAS